jgi:chromate transporter
VKKERKFTTLLVLFITFFKVGLFTFGGGYAMIPIIHKEVVEKRNWANNSDMLDILAISESTPGPIAVNAATYIGFRVGGFWGSFFATLGLAIPSFAIILAISYFYKTFMSWTIVQAAFKGLSIGVIVLLFMAVNKLRKAIPNNILSIVLFTLTLVGMLSYILFQIKIPSISLIFIGLGLVVGLVMTLITRKEKKK